MLEPLPERIDPLRLAETGRSLRGRLVLADLPRFAQGLHDTRGEVLVELRGAIDDQGVRCLHGQAVTTVTLLCQRCLEPMSLPLDVTFRLGLVTSEQQAQRLPEGLEPLVVTDLAMPVAEIVEDELILALPIVALHPEGSVCVQQTPIVAEQETQDKETRQSPFAVLAQLKNSH